MTLHPPKPFSPDWASRLLRSPAFLVGVTTFVVVALCATLLLRDQAKQRFEVEFAREASMMLAEVESQAEITSRDLQQTRSFVASTDPAPSEWRAWARETDLANGSWLDTVAVVRLAETDEIREFRARERLGTAVTLSGARPGSSQQAIVTRVDDADAEPALGFDLFALPAMESILRASARANEPAVGVLPPSLRQLGQLLGDRFGRETEIGPVAAVLPIEARGDSPAGWLAAEFRVEESLAPLATSENLGLAIEFNSDVDWVSGEGISLVGDSREDGDSLAEHGAFATPLLSGSVHVWSLDAPAFGAGEVFMATLLAAVIATLSAVGALLLSRAIRLRRRLGESERELHMDPLTRLRSRVGLERALEGQLAVQGDSGGCLAVMLLDIDRFKVVNDSLGHAVGDELLRAVGGRLRAGISSKDVLGRFGGDEFVVIAPGLDDPKDAEAIAHRLEQALALPVEIGGRSLSVSASIGVAVTRSDGGATPDELIRDADAAMYAAKRDGQAVRLFDASLRNRALDRLAMEEAVISALENGWLRLEYQPIVTMSTGAMAGVEALVRMDHPSLGPLPPDRFLPAAREVGLMGRLGAEVIRMAVADARRWNERFPDEPPLQISINLDESQAADPGLVPYVAEQLEEHGVDASQLCFELSEDALVENLGECIAVLKQLMALGVRLSVDDFGTGRSSLAHLRLLSFVSEVKIDRTFVAGLGSSSSDAEIVGAIVDLAAALQARVVAEGVETREQWRRLVELGVSHAQGFFFSRPQGADVVDDWAGDHGRAVGDRFDPLALQAGTDK